MKMETTCLNDELDRDDLKGCVQGGVHRTAAHLGERCRHPRPPGPSYTPSERASINVLVERGVECGPAQLASAALRVVPVANPTGNRSTVHYSFLTHQAMFSLVLTTIGRFVERSNMH